MALTTIDDRGLKTPIDLLDNEKIRLGTGNDLEIYHDGSNNYFLGTVNNWIKSTGTQGFTAGSDYQLTCVADGAVNLYYDGTKTFETISGGVTVTGTGYVSGGWRPLTDDAVSLGSGSYRWYDLNISNDIKISDGGKIQLGAGPDLEIYSDGTNSFVKCPDTGNNLTIESDQHLYINVGDSENAIKCVNGQDVQLYYDNSLRAYTSTNGFQVYKASSDLVELRLVNTQNTTAGATNTITSQHDARTTAQIVFGRMNDANDFSAAAATTQGDIQFWTAQSGSNTKRATFINSGGLCFGTDTAAANALDDYEEGSFTPFMRASGGSAGSHAMSALSGTYTKVGRLVFFSLQGYLTDKGSWSGTFKWGGLPFTAKNGDNYSCSVSSYPSTVVDGVMRGARIQQNTDYGWITSGSRLDLLADYSEIVTSYYLQLAGTYEAA